MKLIATVLAAGLFFGMDARAKEVDLSAFDGNYKGKGSVIAGGSVYQLNGKAKFKVAKTGRGGKLTLSGMIQTGGRKVPWKTTLVFKKNLKFTTSNVLVVDQGGKLYTAKGTFKLPNRSKLKGSALVKVGASTGVQEVELEIAPKGRKKELEVSLVAKVNGQTNYVFDVELTGK